jgi:diguanylate cyclase (GGDEF)-like protein
MRQPLSLVAAAVILVVTMAVGSYVDLRNDEMHARHLVISTGLANIVRLNQELCAMLMISVLEQNSLRSSSYQTVHAQLELTVNTVEADLSATDGLTGLANRRRFDEALNSEWQRARRLDLPLAVAMIDVDQFKLYNDHFGHQAGDECLRRIAAVLRTCIHRSGDLIARYGGEEFVIILPGLSADKALILAETIRCAVQAEHLVHTKQSMTGVITASIGIAARSPESGQGADDLLRDADKAMYEAKRRGRNRVVAC